ncbi:hypothetical protein C8A00DRAFT_29227 [Chaetomidium leptoderma]|uniref:Uncharacterized protein n=1 Tax=Chaetomidium leptoderma TaxID=669021 RepID=A0AAN6VW04_9PEZI|nr:hypothetical protein C8A00DRAFT_29227 [Chaetomidium leptoderma]
MAAVAPMDLIVGGDPTSIPLQCTLCPKKPNFSDLSHLLTHISSKSHLAHRFKAELKARDNRSALEDVRQYDTWCERYGINALLAERMAAKEQKKLGRRGRPSKTVSNRPGAAAGYQDVVKPDPDEYYDPLPATAHWSAIPGDFQDEHHGHFDNSSYPPPNLKRSRSDHSVPSTPENETRPKYHRRWPSETDTTDSIPVFDPRSESTEFDDENDASKLKGVRYPGMGLFDSADEIQKRMRNQRKDDSVLRNMEETSSGIEPNEFVWTEAGEFRRVRDIYATPSIEGSPDRELEGHETQKPKRGRRSTAAAASGPVRTRVSARQAASRNRRTRNKDSLLGQDDKDGVSGSGDGYDVFHDPLKPSPARAESPLRESAFELRRRRALQSLNSNRSLASATQKPAKPNPYISDREPVAPSFTSQPPVSSGHYFQHQHTMGAGTFNPLCVQTRGGYYNPYGYSNFGNDTKPSTTNFQAINGMNLGNMPFSAFGGPFASDSAHDRVDQDFDL